MGQKVVSILHFAAPPIVGGVEHTIEQHAIRLHKRGYTVQIFAGRGGNFHPDIQFIHIELLDSRHPEILNLGKELARGEVTDEFFRLRDQIKAQLLPYLEKSTYIIVHNVISLHKNLAFTAALYEFALQGKTIIAWCHDFAWQDELYTPYLHSGYPWSLLAEPWPAAQYVVVSHARQEKLSQLLSIPTQVIKVIPPGIDPIEFWGISSQTTRLLERIKLHSSRPIGLLPARITRRKNIEYAIEIIRELVDRLSNACLIVTGPPGPHNPSNLAYLSQLQSIRSELNLDKHVFFLYEHTAGELPSDLSYQSMIELYRLADFLLFPSKREGFGIPILEAGLNRMPVFAANITPIQESSAGNAYLFDPQKHEPEVVATKIAEYLNSSQEYQLRLRILTEYSWREIIDQKILPLFEEIDAK